MPDTRIKICGLRDITAARAAVDGGAHAVGLNFAIKSPRYVTVDQAKAIAGSLPPFVEPVGLFVDASADEIHCVADAVGLRTVQLHGHEPVQLARELAPLRVIKAVHFAAQTLGDLIGQWRRAGDNVAALLLDTPPMGTDPLPGGSGRTFDWGPLAAALSQVPQADRLPVILAGGLTAENVGEAIHVVRPYAVDVSSGVESTRGVKDVEKIIAFCAAVRSASATSP